MFGSSLTRRAFLHGSAVVAGSLGVVGKSPAKASTPGTVWLEMDQAELDAAYDQRNYAVNMFDVIKRYVVNSETARTALGSPRRFAYGDKAIEALDVYPAAGGKASIKASIKTSIKGIKRRSSIKTPIKAPIKAPIHVFVHGGAWRQGTAKDTGFPAELFVNAGAHYVVPDFDWVQNVDNKLEVLADQVRRALAWVYRNAGKFGGDPDRIFVSGHSAGGHLAGVLLTTDWRADFGLPNNLVKGALLSSGMYDLEPVRRSARRSYVDFTDAVVEALSPQRHIDKLRAPLVVAYGTLESPEFQRQSRDFAAAVKAAGKPVQVLVGQHYNHFEILETLASPYGLLGRAALEQMQLHK